MLDTRCGTRLNIEPLISQIACAHESRWAHISIYENTGEMAVRAERVTMITSTSFQHFRRWSHAAHEMYNEASCMDIRVLSQVLRATDLQGLFREASTHTVACANFVSLCPHWRHRHAYVM